MNHKSAPGQGRLHQRLGHAAAARLARRPQRQRSALRLPRRQPLAELRAALGQRLRPHTPPALAVTNHACVDPLS